MNYPIDVILPGNEPGEVCLICHDLKFYFKAKSCKKQMEELCLSAGTTLEGCYDASGHLIGNKYKRPIFLGGKYHQIMIPVSSIKNENGIWVSLDYILTHSVEDFNKIGKQYISSKSWRKHKKDGLALQMCLFHP